MTVIMGATFADGVAVAADTLLHDPGTGATVMNSPKTLAIGNRVAIAQAGEFTGTQGVWEALEKLDPKTVTPQNVADCIRKHAGDIHLARVKSGGCLATWYLVGGIDSSGAPVLMSISIGDEKAEVFHGPGHIVAIGTQSNATEIARDALVASLKPFSNLVKLDEWVQHVVTSEVAASPKYVGFPATLIFVRDDRLIDAQVEDGWPHNSILEGFFP
ncbi:hypothetical protein [Sphingobium yanoikuyae]|uniref:hypothetical protein n=1 Tax=Sphingobium yanoikuyae TaxID=13690 RepID=UPI000262C0B8|nr:hypothetical protein [Sphingobium yanoikuyae]